MPDGSTLTVLAPPTTQLGGLRSINCTSRRLLVGSEGGGGELNLCLSIFMPTSATAQLWFQTTTMSTDR